MSGSDEDEEINEQELFDISNASTQSWESKDRTAATFRMSDPTGLCDMKIYKLICLKKHQMELLLGIHGEVEFLQ